MKSKKPSFAIPFHLHHLIITDIHRTIYIFFPSSSREPLTRLLYVFGDTWFVKEKIPSLGDIPDGSIDNPPDRRLALPSILRSMLMTYSRLLKSLLSPPPGPTSTERPEWQTHVEWLTVMSQNIMSAANDLRPVQARFNLEMMMTRQLELRREETVALHKKCDDLQSRLQELKQATSNIMRLFSYLFSRTRFLTSSLGEGMLI
ncbi:hypothetical protein ACEPAI_3452 [Sanghuangporus weigelae]